MAALKKTDLLQSNTPGDEEGHNNQVPVTDSIEDVDVNELYNINDDDNDVDICDVAPIYTTRNSEVDGHHINNTTAGSIEIEPGSALHGETSIGTATDPGKVPSKRNEALNVINLAISSLQHEIYKSEQERKQSGIIIEQQFASIIEHIIHKQSQIIHKMNAFYDEQKVKSLNRISELKSELDEKELEIQIEREKEIERQLQLKREQEEKEQSLSNYQRLSVFGNKILHNASKYIHSLRNKNNNAPQQPPYSKHDKIRLFMPQKELLKMITTDIKLSTEWWDAFRLNHVLFNTHDATLWRTSDRDTGWYNAFGSIKIAKSQSKRWNIKILERVKQYEKATGRRQPADVVLGIIQSDKRRSQDKQCGFWQKGFDGFGVYGWNGKIFHKKSRGKAYGNPFYAGSVIGIELDMHITTGMKLNPKAKPRLIEKNNLRRDSAGVHGGVLKFYVDDADFGIAAYDLDLNKEYSLAVALNSDVYCLQLID